LSTMFIEWRSKRLACPMTCTLTAFAKRSARSPPRRIMALSGHKTLQEVMRYTAAVDRKKLAASGMAKIEART
jgi:hypothetical protein